MAHFDLFNYDFESMLPKITDIIKFFENEFADIRKQSEWDFSGVQVYTGDRAVSKIALSLDPAEDTIKKAIDEGCELLITHHPLFFRKSQGININKSVDKRGIAAIKGGLDILSYHTNFDIASGGTSDYICEMLGFETESGYLSKEGTLPLYRLEIYVPADYKDKVFDAVSKAGAGKLGNYTSCGFTVNGAGTFKPNEQASPFVGKAGVQEVVDEIKIEIVTEEKYLAASIQAMLAAHPYEEPAYAVIKLNNGLDYGFGKVCRLPHPYHLSEFITLLNNIFKIGSIRTNMEDIAPFSSVAVCTGSGSSFWVDCQKRGVSVLITGDMKYHDAMDAAENGVCIIDMGHQASEEIFMNRVSSLLKEKFKVQTFVYNKKKQIISWG